MEREDHKELFSFSFKKGKTSSVQRKLGNRYPEFQVGERRFEKTIGEEGGGDKEEKLHDRKRLLIG